MFVKRWYNISANQNETNKCKIASAKEHVLDLVKSLLVIEDVTEKIINEGINDEQNEMTDNFIVNLVTQQKHKM